METRTQKGIIKRLREKATSLGILGKVPEEEVTRLANDSTVLQKAKELDEARTTSLQYKLQTIEAETKDVNYRHKKKKVEKFGK